MADHRDPSKHHFIPEFYLRGWTGEDGRFERYTRPIPNKIAVRRVFPSETGWLRDLYASPGHELGNYWLETRIFQQIDNNAARTLRKLNGNPSLVSAEERSSWTLFLRSLFHRTPENLRATIASASAIWDETIEELRASYDRRRGPHDPLTFDEYKATRTPLKVHASAQTSLPNLMANPKIGEFLQSLHTRIITLPPEARDFLLSDDPLARSNGLKKNGGHIAIPISPRKLFVSAWQEDFLDEITAMSPGELVKGVNCWVVESARHFVVARDVSQDRFIRNRFGNAPKDPIMN
jgi:hypothetical protein